MRRSTICATCGGISLALAIAAPMGAVVPEIVAGLSAAGFFGLAAMARSRESSLYRAGVPFRGNPSTDRFESILGDPGRSGGPVVTIIEPGPIDHEVNGWL